MADEVRVTYDGQERRAMLVYSSNTTSATLPAGTSRSGSITLGGTAQDLAAANTSRKSLTIQNISSGDLWINENGGTASVEGTDAYRLTPGAWASASTNEKVSIIGATTGQKFTAMET